ncbi:MAG: hypothetical protein LBL76_01695 [Treponema sp.]|jgi:hypothetical protein|nr:hypothetical protein [Treponema sp.]
MKKSLVLSMLLTLSCIGVNAQTKGEIQTRYLEYLKSIGLLASVTEQGNISFQTLGGNFIIGIDEAFPNALLLAMPGIMKLETEDMRLKSALTALGMTKDFNDVEIYLHDDEWIGMRIVEYLIAPDDFKINFNQYVRLLLQVGSEFSRRYSRL